MINHQSFFKRKLFMGVTIGAGAIFIIIGIVLWGGFNTVLELTNREQFCISCHEMEENVYEEYKKTIHYANRSGVRATCPDCHVPKEWIYKIKRKIQASNEVLHKILGTIDTPEKFNNKRLELAKHEWARMKANDSRECRNCHDFESMSIAYQKPRARQQHANALKNGNTCIDCHKGIAHSPVHQLMDEEELEKMSAPNPEFARANATLRQPVNKKQQDLLDLSNNPRKPEVKVVIKTVIKEIPAQCNEVDVKKQTSSPEKTISSNSFGLDWSQVPGRNITIFYPGQSSMEWIFKGSEHGGKLPFVAGDRCINCHDKEAADMGRKIVTGEKLEKQVIDGKRGSIAVTVQAMFDTDKLYMRFQWTNSEHTPVPFVEGGKMDPQNQVKLAMMFSDDNKREEDDFTGSVLYSGRVGCWATCHHDAKDMPDAPTAEDIAAYDKKDQVDMQQGIRKYLTESRTNVEIAGRRGKKLGGWNKLKEADEIQAELDAGHFMDLIRYQAGTKKSENGYILADRVMQGGQDVEFTAKLENGIWTVEMIRELKSAKAGDVSMQEDKLYNFGFAIHDDYTNGRFHHVSLGYKLGFNNDKAEVNAVRNEKK